MSEKPGDWAELAARADARALPPSDYGSTRAIQSVAALLRAAYERGQSENIAAWNRRAGGEGWRAIETAPRDGTKFDVWMGRDGYRICDVYWSDIHDWWSTDGAYGPKEPTPLASYSEPTHWRPLPAAPGDEG